jgi:hypothetical protein
MDGRALHAAFHYAPEGRHNLFCILAASPLQIDDHMKAGSQILLHLCACYRKDTQQSTTSESSAEERERERELDFALSRSRSVKVGRPFLPPVQKVSLSAQADLQDLTTSAGSCHHMLHFMVQQWGLFMLLSAAF